MGKFLGTFEEKEKNKQILSTGSWVKDQEEKYIVSQEQELRNVYEYFLKDVRSWSLQVYFFIQFIETNEKNLGK